jgi:flagellar hook-basal body complex protein FliE
MVSMSLNIDAIRPIVPPTVEAPQTADAWTGEFKNVLSAAIDEVGKAQNGAAQTVESFLKGEGGDLHSTILNVQRADLEFDMFMQVRNKIVSAYQEVMRLQM